MPPFTGPAPVDLALTRLVRMATATDTTPRRMARATSDALESWRDVAGGRDRATSLRAMLAAGLTEALKQANVAEEMEQQQAQKLVDVLRAGVEVLDEGLAKW